MSRKEWVPALYPWGLAMFCGLTLQEYDSSWLLLWLWLLLPPWLVVFMLATEKTSPSDHDRCRRRRRCSFCLTFSWSEHILESLIYIVYSILIPIQSSNWRLSAAGVVRLSKRVTLNQRSYSEIIPNPCPFHIGSKPCAALRGRTSHGRGSWAAWNLRSIRLTKAMSGCFKWAINCPLSRFSFYLCQFCVLRIWFHFECQVSLLQLGYTMKEQTLPVHSCHSQQEP